MLISVKDSYFIMFRVLEDYYIDHKSDDSLASLLGDLSPNLFSTGISADPAAFADWKKTVKLEDSESLLESSAIILYILDFLRFYQNNFGFRLSEIISYIKNDPNAKQNIIKFMSNK